MRMTAALLLLILAPLFAVAATPVVNSGTINYSTNQITLTGSGFQPNKTKPAIAFNGSALTVLTFSNTQVTATLPTGLTPGTFDLTVTNSQSNSVVFNMTYGATGPQGPAGPAGPQGPAGLSGATGAAGATGPAGASGPRGLTGAPGAPGPAGANGTSFLFLDAYNPYATYTADNVVTYNGSSYIAIVPNGPNPSGPAPDQNPSWSLMAAVGAAGTTGPAGTMGPPGPNGEQGLTGLMGNPGSAGPAGPVGPQGPAGGVLSFVVSPQQPSPNFVAGAPANVNFLVLPNLGTYVIGGQQTIVNGDSVNAIQPGCYLYDGTNYSPGLLLTQAHIPPNSIAVLPFAGYYVATSAPITLTETCQAESSSAIPLSGVLTAIQVQ